MTDFVYWPGTSFPAADTAFNVRPSSRGSEMSLGGIGRWVKTDTGFWTASHRDIVLRPRDHQQKRIWSALQTAISGRASLVVVPYCVGKFIEPAFRGPPDETLFDDDTTFDDDTPFVQGIIQVNMGADAAIGDTVVQLAPIFAPEDLVGMPFSYEHALYKIGPVISEEGGLVEVSISPPVRMAIPAGAPLEFSNPDCLMHLASDEELDIEYPMAEAVRATVNFVEATGFWNDLAVA